MGFFQQASWRRAGVGRRSFCVLLLGICMLFGHEASGIAATYSLTPSTLTAQPGQTISVTWNVAGGVPSGKDWIGLFRVGDPNSAYDGNRWRYTNGFSPGSFTTTAPSAAGTYEFRYLVNDSFTSAASSPTITISTGTNINTATVNNSLNTANATGAALVVSGSTTVSAGQSISVNWTVPSGSAKDWIGWFRVGVSNSAFDPNRWRYTNAATSGTYTITAPSTAGDYEFRYLLNDGFTSSLRSQTVTVTSGTVANTTNTSTSTTTNVTTSAYTLVASLVTVQAGQPLSVNWTSPAGSPKDWISIYRVGDANTAFDRSRWRYTNGTATGSFATTAPDTAGTYEFRYLFNDGYNSTARSQTITVTPATGTTTATNTATSTAHALVVSSTSVQAGETISVNWKSPLANSKDWVALYRVGDPASAYDQSRWRYVNGYNTGTFTTTAPTTAGVYEFRYLLNDSYSSAASSAPITVGTAPVISFSSTPESITTGQSTRLVWSTTNASSCDGSGGWSGSKGVSGLQDVTPNATTTYILTCSGSGGSTSRNISVIVASKTGGNTYYLATSGNDNNPGTETLPFKTLKKAVLLLRPGDTLLIRAGEYDTGAGLSGALSHNGASIIPSGTSWGTPVTLKAYPGEKPVFRRYLPQGYAYTEDEVRNSIHLPTYQECAQYASYGLVSDFPYSCWQGSGNNQPAGGLYWQAPKGFVDGYVVDMINIRVPVQYVVFDGIDIDAKGIVPGPIGFSDYSKHIRFQNLEIRYGIGSCISQSSADPNVDMDLQFINTKIHSCGVPFDTNTINGVLARKTIWARYWHGWYLHAGGASFINSESYNHAGTGLGPDGNNIVIRNSYIHDNAVQGLYISGGSNWLVENNVFYNNGWYEIFNHGGRNHVIRNNTIVAGPRNNFLTTGVASAGIYLNQGSIGSINENNIIDGFRYGVYDGSMLWQPNVIRNNLIRSSPAGSEIQSTGSNIPIKTNNIFNLDPLFVNRSAIDFRLQSGSPAIGTATDGGNIGAR